MLPNIHNANHNARFRLSHPSKPNPNTAKAHSPGLYATSAILSQPLSSSQSAIREERSSLHSKSVMKVGREMCSPNGNVYMEKVWLIRRIGDLLGEDNRVLSAKRKNIRRKLNRKFREFNRDSDRLMDLIKEEGSSSDPSDLRHLKHSLK